MATIHALPVIPASTTPDPGAIQAAAEHILALGYPPSDGADLFAPILHWTPAAAAALEAEMVKLEELSRSDPVAVARLWEARR